MIQFLEKDEFLEVWYKGHRIFKLDKDKGIEVGIGNDTYVMRRGAFKFREKAKRFRYSFIRIEKKSEIPYMVFENQRDTISLYFEIKASVLLLRFKYTNPAINRVYLNLCTTEDEYTYGCGEQFAALNLKYKKVKNWVSEHVALSSLIKKAFAYQFNLKVKLMAFDKYASYMVQPTFVTSKKRFVHLDINAYSHFEFGTDTISVEVREAISSLYIGVYSTYEEMMDCLTQITGKQPRLPEWVFDGMILGIQDGTKVCHEKALKMVQKGAAINGIWAQDWEGQRITKFGKQLFWNWRYDPKLYANLPAYIKRWETMRIRFLGYINPFLAVEGDLYQEAKEKDILVKNQKGEVYLVTITTFPAAMIDLTHPEGYRFIKEIIKTHMIGIGLKGWMADFAEYLPTDCVLYSQEDPRIVHNTWPVRWAKCNKEAIEEVGLSDEIFFFVRAGYTGTGHYSKMMWNGDQHVDWSRDYGIGSIVNSQLSLGLTGIGNSHSDIGGYTTFGKMTRSQELLLRWIEMNAFSMVMRSHEGNQPDKNHQFDSDSVTIEHIVKFTRIYKHLKPYHLAIDAENAATGMPSIRPLFFYYDQAAYYDADQVYLLGRDLLVYPVVTKGQVEMSIDLPVDQWVHAFTGEAYTGGQITLPCPIGKPMVFYREKSPYKKLFEGILRINDEKKLH